MASNHPSASRSPRTGEPARPQPPADAVLRNERDAHRHEKGSPGVAPPRAGRTGGLGARAERPSEGTQRPGTAKPPEPGRSSKAPSARDTLVRTRAER